MLNPDDKERSLERVAQNGETAPPASPSPQPLAAFLYAVPIAILGGLIGLGGAEFRLPVLAGPLGYSAKRAVPLNLAVSLITILSSLIVRGSTLSLEALEPLAFGIGALIAGAVVAAFLGTAFAGKLSEHQLHRIILALLLFIGLLLIVEGFLPYDIPALLPAAPGWHITAGILFGLAIGLVSSLLGVAGGELIIPTLVFAYGADIKTAGTGSLCISLPTVLIGVLRYARQGAYLDRQALLFTVAPMGVGSIIGAVIGGLLVGMIPAGILKVGLGFILIASALGVFKVRKRH